MYKRKDQKAIFEKAKELIESDDNVLFIDDVIAGLPISKPTFYSWWPKGSNEYNEIWDLITKNRISVKKYIRLKLRVSGKASELLALYRMICTDEERRAIYQNYLDLKADVNGNIQIGFVESDYSPVSDEDKVEL